MHSMMRRTLLCSLALSYGAQGLAQGIGASSPREPAHVVFVCEHGSVKSLIAMEYFNRSVQERGLAYRAVARGTDARGRDEIVRHVDDLIDELARSTAP